MRLRRRWVLAGLGLLLIGTPLVFGCIYAGRALLRHEHLYRGLPTSYWERAVRAWEPPGRPLPAWMPAWAAPVAKYLGLTGEPAILHGGPSAVPVLYDLFHSEDASVCWQAADALSHILPPSEAEVMALAHALGKEYRNLDAILALQRLGTAARAAAPALRHALLCEKGPREELMLALCRVDPAYVPWLAGFLNDPNPNRRLGIAKVFERLGALGHGAAGALVNALADRHPDVNASVLQALLQMGPNVVIPLIGGLRDTNPKVRRQAARTLGIIGPVEAAPAVPALIIALRDPDQDVRPEAADALRKIDPDAALVALQKVVLDADAAMAADAAWALETIGPAAVPTLIRALATPGVVARSRVAKALGTFGAKAKPAVPALGKALKDEDVRVRQSAAEALHAIDPEAAARAGIR
jgi:hypothetical protein